MNVLVEAPDRKADRAAPKWGKEFNFSPWHELPARSEAFVHVKERTGPPISWWERAAAMALIVVVLPLMLLIAIAIKISSPGGPVIYRQERVGLNRRKREVGGNGDGTDEAHGNGLADRRREPGLGQTFQIYKFRTMIPDAERKTGPIWAAERDPRVTRFGSVLRRLRMDELPQLINIVRGQMRLIGPRPERPHFVNQLAREIPGYAERLRVPPGITGLAQVERHYDAGVKDVRTKVGYDLYYVENRCALLDLKIMILTLDVMLRGRGAR